MQANVIQSKPLVLSIVFVMTGIPGYAQNFSSAGNDWGAGWGFQSPTDRSLSIQQAQAIRNATSSGPSTIVNTANYSTYDNRSGYLDAGGSDSIFGDLDININGDEIGQNTNSVGAMNTGTTNIEVSGNQNVIDATNAAESDGCIDGSVALTDAPFASMETASGIDITLGLTGQTDTCIE